MLRTLPRPLHAFADLASGHLLSPTWACFILLLLLLLLLLRCWELARLCCLLLGPAALGCGSRLCYFRLADSSLQLTDRSLAGLGSGLILFLASPCLPLLACLAGSAKGGRVCPAAFACLGLAA